MQIKCAVYKNHHLLDGRIFYILMCEKAIRSIIRGRLWWRKWNIHMIPIHKAVICV